MEGAGGETVKWESQVGLVLKAGHYWKEKWEVGNRHKDMQEDELTGREVERKRGALWKWLRMHCFEDEDGKSGKGLTTETLRTSAENQRRHSQRGTVVQWLFLGKDREMVDPEKSTLPNARYGFPSVREFLSVLSHQVV